MLLALLWVLHWLPLSVQALIGRGLGLLLHAAAGARRQIALRNVALCFPEMPANERASLVRTHFQWLGRSILERGVLWYASPARLRRLIHVEGDVTLAERSERPVMWLVPHFMALDVAGAATQLFQQRRVNSIYQQQSDAVMDEAMRRGRLRFDNGDVFPRSDSAKPLLRAIRRGEAFFNLPDMDFGERDSAFVPFFGVPASTASSTRGPSFRLTTHSPIPQR
jgi:Kdo2-lipid IVA lauroyltransferase/acyltransferase